jgi:hypothetical protein
MTALRGKLPVRPGVRQARAVGVTFTPMHRADRFRISKYCSKNIIKPN